MPKNKRKRTVKLAPVAPATSEDHEASSDDCMDMLEEDLQEESMDFLAALNP